MGGRNVSRREYELNAGLVCRWKECIMVRNEKRWEEEVNSKSTLKLCELVKNGTGVES